MSLTAGTVLGQYEIRSPLGAGGMGEVYRAHDTRLDRDVAIKVLPEYLTCDPERLCRFEQEARATAALNHPNILAVHQMATDNGVSYLVEELLEGETLRERLRHGPIPLRKAIDYAVQIAHGLAVAHDRGIVHRDLKPENLFITKEGRVKILDFGLARLGPSKEASGDEATVTQRTDPGVVLGTAGYMSPEQVRGKTIEHRTDIFAFGTVLYEMITGKQPFRKPTSADTMAAILNEEPPSLSQISASTPLGLQRVVHRCLEKDPEQRFHSAHDLAFALEALSDSAITTPSGSHPQASGGWTRRQKLFAGITGITVLALAGLAYLRLRPEPAPRVSNYVQLTHDGQPKVLIGTDGSRLYLSLGSDVSLGIGEIAPTGGEPTRIPPPFPGASPLNLSPDGSQLLVIKSKIGPGNRSLYSLALSGGSARRLGDALGWGGAWSPDGKLLAYSNDSDLFMAKADGTESRKLVRMKAHIYGPVWSPDGTHLRFEAEENWEGSLWEIATDGTGVHRLLPSGWHNPSDECCGRWTADGSYFVFQSSGQIWALPKNGGFLHRNPSPIQLTSSPLALSSPLPSKDGKKLFVVGETDRGELVRYDLKSGQFLPFLGGISVDFLDFSKDGQWVAYVSYPEGTLWRSKADGSERLQLTFGPDHAIMPRWSPDGKKIIFEEQPNAGKGYRVYEVSPEGGTPRELLASGQSSQLHADWSPDGAKIVFGGGFDDPQSVIRILDFTDGQISTVPGSQGFFFPRWSPNGRYIVARAFGPHRLVLFDFQTQRWTELVQGGAGTESWSKDGVYVYDLLWSPASAVIRIRISDHKSEQVVDLKDFPIAGDNWLALAADDSPVLLRDTGTQDVYALDWEEP